MQKMRLLCEPLFFLESEQQILLTLAHKVNKGERRNFSLHPFDHPLYPSVNPKHTDVVQRQDFANVNLYEAKSQSAVEVSITFPLIDSL